MRKFVLLSLVLSMVFLLSGISAATNGDNLFAIGPIARSMGGVGIAAPQDAMSAVFANPAALCFGPYCPGSEVNFDATLFMPNAHTKIKINGVMDSGWKSSESDMFLIPAIGISTPITDKLRFGFAAYGVSGLGVDYRNKFDLNPFSSSNDDIYTNLSVMKIAPNIAYMITPNLSIGASLHIDYGMLNMGNHGTETASNWGFGGQLGAIYKNGPVSLGLVYVSPQKIKYNNVADFDMNGDPDNLTLESPQSVGFGIAIEPIQKVLLVEANVNWLNWSDAIGYRDFGWKDQWVYSIGTQFKPTPKLALRLGYNYGKSPVRAHSWDDNNGTVGVQGKDVWRTQYEFLRIAGFPAIVEQHITAGIGYEITKSISLNIGYTHAFQKHIAEKGTVVLPGPFVTSGSVESTLSENSVDFGLTWRF